MKFIKRSPTPQQCSVHTLANPLPGKLVRAFGKAFQSNCRRLPDDKAVLTRPSNTGKKSYG